MFNSILNEALTLESVLACTGASLALGAVIALFNAKSGQYSRGFLLTTAILPVLIQMIIMLVNGNLGTAVAVMGAFSLVRFRSVPGNSREICAIMFAMAVGLATGAGYVAFAALFTVVIGLILLLLSRSLLGSATDTLDLRITLPENFEFSVFDQVFEQYASFCELQRVKTTNMGSLYELTYRLRLRDGKEQKAFIDQLRCRNGNLAVSCCRSQTAREEL